MNTCPKCGAAEVDTDPRRMEFKRVFECRSTLLRDGCSVIEHRNCLTNQRDALLARVEALEKAWDMMHKYCRVDGPESLLAKLEWADAKVKGTK